MPWPAVPFTSDVRECALAALKVQGIPQLTVFGQDGKMLEQNAVQKMGMPGVLDSWMRGSSG